MTDEGMQVMLVDWLATVAKCEVIREYQSGKLPKLPYIGVHYTGSREVRDNERDYVYEDADQETPPRIWAAPIIEVEYTFSINGYSSYSPTDLLRPLRSAVAVTQTNEPLMPVFQIHGVSDIRNLHAWANEAWNNRAQMDLWLRGLEVDGHLIDTIEEYKFIFSRSPGGV